MSISTQCLECQSEEIQSSTSEQQKIWSMEALFQLYFLYHHVEQKIAKDMWKQSLSKKTQFQASNLHFHHLDQTFRLRSRLSNLLDESNHKHFQNFPPKNFFWD
jgi:type II secretory ATPase GspE/PulE/Tfp pilus assembly ATPase PilB-like protein